MVSSKVDHPGIQGTREAGEIDRRLEPSEAPSETDFNIQRQTLMFTIKGSPGYGLLLHRHRFRQVTRLVNVGALEHGNVIRQQLQRDGVEDWRQGVVDVRHVDDVGAFGVGHAGFFIGKND